MVSFSLSIKRNCTLSQCLSRRHERLAWHDTWGLPAIHPASLPSRHWSTPGTVHFFSRSDIRLSRPRCPQMQCCRDAERRPRSRRPTTFVPRSDPSDREHCPSSNCKNNIYDGMNAEINTRINFTCNIIFLLIKKTLKKLNKIKKFSRIFFWIFLKFFWKIFEKF